VVLLKTRSLKMKYSVGQRVTIRKYEAMARESKINEAGDVSLSRGCFRKDMKKYCGSQLTISEIRDDYYKMEEDNGYWCWTDDMIEHNFTYGEEIEVSDYCEHWVRKIFIGFIDGGIIPYLTTPTEEFNDVDCFVFCNYKHARKIENKVKITIDGQDLYISKESAEELRKLGGR
jgi:hypothetical protein